MVHKVFKTVELKDLLSDCDLVQVESFVNKDDWNGLREFLRSKEKELMSRGVVPDYLYYQIEYNVKYGGGK
jgi:hypothetical protein